MQSSVDHRKALGFDTKMLGNQLSVLGKSVIRFVWKRLQMLWKERILAFKSFSVHRAVSLCPQVLPWSGWLGRQKALG